MGRKRAKRIRCTDEEFRMFKQIQQQCDAADVPIEHSKHGWAKSKQSSVFWKNPLYKDPEVLDYMELRDTVIQMMNKHSPKYPKLQRRSSYKDNLAFISLADFHFNKLCEKSVTGESYDLDEAKRRLSEGVSELIELIEPFKVNKFCLVIGNDILNSDTPTGTTTGGTPQDNDKHWTTAYEVAKMGVIYTIEMLVQIADVHVIHCPSNHDYQSGFFMADAVKSWFRLHENITFDVSIRHRKYYQYGKNMIETDHGDGCKPHETPLIMAEENAEMWASSKHRYSYKHHLHHKDAKTYQRVKEFTGVTVEYLSSPSVRDSWHDKKGYISRPALEVALHHFEHGKFGHFTHRFR